MEQKKYNNGEITIIWKPKTCTHSAICFRGLRSVFDPAKRPWINVEASDTQSIIDQIGKCPSGALSFYFNEESKPEEQNT